MQKVKNLREFVKIYPDDKREHVISFGIRYKNKFVNDVSSDYFDWALDAIKKDDEDRRGDKILDKLSLDDCLFFTDLVEANGR